MVKYIFNRNSIKSKYLYAECRKLTRSRSFPNRLLIPPVKTKTRFTQYNRETVGGGRVRQRSAPQSRLRDANQYQYLLGLLTYLEVIVQFLLDRSGHRPHRDSHCTLQHTNTYVAVTFVLLYEQFSINNLQYTYIFLC